MWWPGILKDYIDIYGDDMTGALVILAFTVVVGLGLYLWDVAWRKKHPAQGGNPDADGQTDVTAADEAAATDSGEEECCGQHLVCEKTHAAAMTAEVVYYDDEELDRYAGRDGTSYTPEETDEFRDIMLTLLPSDVAGWAHSLDLRKIALPAELRDELLMLMSDVPAEGDMAVAGKGER